MAHINEPEGVDFLIKSPPLTNQERKEISEFIKKLKLSNMRKKLITSRRKKKEKV